MKSSKTVTKKTLKTPAGKSAKAVSKNSAASAEVKAPKLPPSNKKKYTLEYIIKSSPVILYEFLTTPSLMAEWFADEVDSFKNEYLFTWEREVHKAKVIDSSENEFIRFRWLDEEHHDEYFEFRITSTEITGDTVLTITDFFDPKEREDETMLWDSQVKALTQHIGGLG